MAEYRVDELARRAGTSVRNVRVYQDRGLLAPPRRQGRVGYYSDDHLERLQLIGRLLERGYTFATIHELLEAWDGGGGLGHVLGLGDAIGGPWSEEEPGYLTITDLRDRFGTDSVTPAFLEQAAALGVLVPDGSGYRVPSMRLLDAGTDLVAIGIPMQSVLDLAAAMRVNLDRVAELFFRIVNSVIPQDVESASDAEHTIAEVISQLRPHALAVVEAMFAVSMHEQADQMLQAVARRRRTGSARVLRGGGREPADGAVADGAVLDGALLDGALGDPLGDPLAIAEGDDAPDAPGTAGDTPSGLDTPLDHDDLVAAHDAPAAPSSAAAPALDQH